MLQLKVVLDRGVFRPDVPWGWQATRHPPSTWDTLRVTSVVVLGAGLQLDIGGRALRGRVDLLALRGQSTLGSTPARACANLDTSGGAAAHRRCCGPHSVEPVGQQGIVRKCSKQARSFGLPQSIAVRLTSLLVKDTVHRPFSPKTMVAAGMSSRGALRPHFIPRGIKIASLEYQRIVEDYYIPEGCAMFDAPVGDWELQQDNAPSHVSKSTIKFFKNQVFA